MAMIATTGLKAIRAAIDLKYAEYGPSTPTVKP